ncbi:MAG: NAD(P)/FAD-dependent oxidoreductase [Phycisphaerales bacterium JB043]
MSESNGSYDVDVLVIGGGPAGTTVGSMLKTYNPDISVQIMDKDTFPRDHVGESQLPGVSKILHEIGVWDKMEAQNFPIKLGAVYRWGKDEETWNFDFVDHSLIPTTPRPHAFEGARTRTAFQVDRLVYDKILFDHAAELGCTTEQGVQMTKVNTDGDRITSMEFDDGRSVTAKHYVDCTGASATIRRAMGVGSQAPEELRNVAFWDYWDGADWGADLGDDINRIHVRSIHNGWIWFIPISRTRTSVGFVTLSKYYKSTGKSKEELYEQAIKDEPYIEGLLANATRDGVVRATNDWSHLADRMHGENWFMAGESCGFADPILAAGLLLHHGSARECAFTINEIEIGEQDEQWLRERYTHRNKKNIWQYIRFAQFWYAANGCFTDLQEQCAEIAKEGGLKLEPKQAWRWLSQGGFALEEVLNPAAGSFDPLTSKDILGSFLGEKVRPNIENANVFKLNTHGAEKDKLGYAHEGRIHPVPCLKKQDYYLPLGGTFGNMVHILERTDDLGQILQMIQGINPNFSQYEQQSMIHHHLAALDSMIDEGWVLTKLDPKRPVYSDPNW